MIGTALVARGHLNVRATNIDDQYLHPKKNTGSERRCDKSRLVHSLLRAAERGVTHMYRALEGTVDVGDRKQYKGDEQ